MRRPVWRLELARTTNAPFKVVRTALLAEARPWHPRPGCSPLEISTDRPGLLELKQSERPLWGVEECATYRVESFENHLLLSYQARFKGWPVLILMGYWRLKSHRIWERFVESL